MVDSNEVYFEKYSKCHVSNSSTNAHASMEPGSFQDYHILSKHLCQFLLMTVLLFDARNLPPAMYYIGYSPYWCMISSINRTGFFSFPIVWNASWHKGCCPACARDLNEAGCCSKKKGWEIPNMRTTLPETNTSYSSSPWKWMGGFGLFSAPF